MRSTTVYSKYRAMVRADLPAATRRLASKHAANDTVGVASNGRHVAAQVALLELSDAVLEDRRIDDRFWCALSVLVTCEQVLAIRGRAGVLHFTWLWTLGARHLLMLMGDPAVWREVVPTDPLVGPLPSQRQDTKGVRLTLHAAGVSVRDVPVDASDPTPVYADLADAVRRRDAVGVDSASEAVLDHRLRARRRAGSIYFGLFDVFPIEVVLARRATSVPGSESLTARLDWRPDFDDVQHFTQARLPAALERAGALMRAVLDAGP